MTSGFRDNTQGCQASLSGQLKDPSEHVGRRRRRRVSRSGGGCDHPRPRGARRSAGGDRHGARRGPSPRRSARRRCRRRRPRDGGECAGELARYGISTRSRRTRPDPGSREQCRCRGADPDQCDRGCTPDHHPHHRPRRWNSRVQTVLPSALCETIVACECSSAPQPVLATSGRWCHSPRLVATLAMK